MADVAAIRQGLAINLGTIPGLRVSSTIPENFNPPAAIVGFPETINFDATFRRGSDRMEFPVRVYAVKADSKTAQETLDEYLAGSGAKSIKAALESDNTANGSVDWVHCTSARNYGVYSVGGVDYLGVEFVVEVMASGT